MAEPKRCLIAAGGTGGHMFPARACADELIARGWEVRLMTDQRGRRHAQDFPADEIYEVEAKSPSTRNPIKLAGAVTALSKGRAQAIKTFKAWRPDAVAGFGGYPAFPALSAAKALGVPYVIHEQNAVLGRVNRRFAEGAYAVASGFSRLDRLSPKARQAVTGNPVRAAILAASSPYTAPAADGPIRLLILGGSLGARILSDIPPRAVALLPEALRARLEVIQQTREESLEAARAAYAAAGVKAECEPFFQDMGARYAAADLILARAGASTVGEVAAMGRPAIFAPLPIAADDHQTANAEELVKAGAAERLADAEMTPERLADRLAALLGDGESLAERARRAGALGKPQAANALADLIEAAAGGAP